jgi:hypothetical protein
LVVAAPRRAASFFTAAAERVRALAGEYVPPAFEHVPDPDAAIFLCAIDHRSGYRSGYLVDGRGPHEGSALLWEVGLAAGRREPRLLTAAALRDIDGERLAAVFRIGGETVAGPERRAALWRDMAAGLERDHDGSAAELIGAAGGLLGGSGGLIALLAEYDAYADPLAKKAFLFAKIAERRGWLEVADPDSWEVCADSVLMRLALRAGLVDPGELEDVRAATRSALKELAAEAGVSPPVLDDMLWELGRDDPDLLGRPAGDLREPSRDPSSDWY